jgi:hypothetical protein
MANKKLTDLPEKIIVPNNAWVHIVDPSDLTDSPQGTNFKVRKSNISGSTGSIPTLQQVLDEGNTSETDLNIQNGTNISSITSTGFKSLFSPTDQSEITGKSIKSFGASENIEVNADEGIVFTDNSTVKRQRIRKSSAITNDNQDFFLPNKPSGNYTFATTDDIPSISDIQIYKIISANITIDNSYHNAICFISTTCTITIPSGLRPDFACVFDALGAITGTFVASGSVISSPFGAKLSNNAIGSCVTTGINNYRLNGGFSV